MPVDSWARLKMQVKSNGFGLGLLPPAPRLLFVVLVTSGFVWIKDLTLAAIAFVLGMILILLNRKKNYAMVVTLVGTTVATYFLGNLLFSPASLGSREWFIFRVNRLGV